MGHLAPSKPLEFRTKKNGRPTNRNMQVEETKDKGDTKRRQKQIVHTKQEYYYKQILERFLY